MFTKLYAGMCRIVLQLPNLERIQMSINRTDKQFLYYPYKDGILYRNENELTTVTHNIMNEFCKHNIE